MSGTWTVAEYKYDGAKRRSVKEIYASGALDETRHFFYTEPSKWQVVEERVGTSSDAERQFVWGLRYVDDVVERDRDTTGDEALDERLYGLQDANWNVTGLVDENGSIQERYSYAAYGQPNFWSPAWGSRGFSAVENEIVFTGRRRDAETAFDSYRARSQHALTGRFLSRDLSGYAGREWNLYEYGGSNPTRRMDPFGLRSISGDPVGVLVICAVSFGFKVFCPKLTHICFCDYWVTTNRRSGYDWQKTLPNCPCSIGNPPANPAPNDWFDPTPGSPTYHPGAAHCIRSKPSPGPHAQQCCYDDTGALITGGSGAGTPDYAAYPSPAHGVSDALSFEACCRIGAVDEYFKYRKPNNGNNCPPNEVDKPFPCEGSIRNPYI
jgi:RHS repeat-associated protein